MVGRGLLNPKTFVKKIPLNLKITLKFSYFHNNNKLEKEGWVGVCHLGKNPKLFFSEAPP